jgi:hypothetical protein
LNNLFLQYLLSPREHRKKITARLKLYLNREVDGFKQESSGNIGVHLTIQSFSLFFTQVLRIITHLLHLVTRLTPSQGTPEANLYLRRRVHSILVQMDPRTASGDTLLHLSVAKNNTLKSQNIFEDGHYAFFPSLDVAKLLVECGGRVNAMNKANSTPLHTAVAANNYQLPVGVRIVIEATIGGLVISRAACRAISARRRTTANITVSSSVLCTGYVINKTVSCVLMNMILVTMI